MPLYEYRCRACGERFEILQRLGADGSGLVCPRCAEPEPQRVLSTFAAQGAGGRDAAAASGGACCRGPGRS
jgi:putative FmdB family regulatory protein